MTTSDYSTRTAVVLDTVHEHDHEHDHDMHHELDLNSYVRPTNEANTTGGVDQTNLDRSISPNKPNSDTSSKRNRIQAVFLSRSNANDKKTSTVSANSVVVLSNPTNNTSGPGGGTNGRDDICEHANIVAALSQHASAAMPVASLALLPPPQKLQPTISNASSSSSSSTAKQFLIGRVRSRSKSDPQSVPDKSLFSKFFPKKTKKPLPTLLTTTTKAIENQTNINSNKKRQNMNNNLLTTNYQRSNNYEDDDDELDDRTASTGSLSDNVRQNNKHDGIGSGRSSNTIRGGSRTSSGSGKNISAGPNALSLPTSDSQYYASMSSAPTGFSISYHKRMSKGNDGLRLQAALGRLQQQSKQSTTTSGGTSQLLSLFQDPKRSGAQSPNNLTGSTRLGKTHSGQTTIIAKNSSSDQPSVYCIRPTSSSSTQDIDDTFISDDEIYTQFMRTHTCYDIMPKSSKLVVFDTQLAVKKAFYALVHNGVRAAPIWDTKRQRFTAMLTITDFILILQKYYKEPNAKIEELEEHRIETWREVLREYEKPLLSIKPTDSLFEAVRTLVENHVHRLPIVDPISHNVIFILTHKRILRFLYLYIYDWPQPTYLCKTLEELNLGTYHNMHIIDENTTVIEALNQFVKYRISALPIVDSQRKLVNIYSKFDVIGLAADKTYTNLNMTIKEALSYRKERLETVAKCYKNETLAACMERIVKAEVHRLVVVDNDEHVIGVLSLSDLLNYIVIRPTKTQLSVSPPPPSTTTQLVPTINVFNEDDPVVEEDENTDEEAIEKKTN
ncbi:unnamed protein product [Rotaria sp. Silwood2]|nr:unnamed protein product [Rotaria sp. Silwood2]CAF2714217.1 unnamed protein product [Rotaria sp. Silwood2]CAF2884206.1 unnamed protein product [Rotaria sp. Silwood2]CAF3105227.1 unnamed protein product [Rotaria sp. Silwood2]CAF3920658.1 unnamed protein product [Rotaria sp. Silwood2]